MSRKKKSRNPQLGRLEELVVKYFTRTTNKGLPLTLEEFQEALQILDELTDIHEMECSRCHRNPSLFFSGGLCYECLRIIFEYCASLLVPKKEKEQPT